MRPDKDYLYQKYQNGDVLSQEECEWLTYYESFKSRSDSEHLKGSDPLVGALIQDKNGRVLELSHRASGQEGDHAEYSLLKGRLIGEDLTDCILYTTLEPCVDDGRSKEGTSCSSLICKSEIKDVRIGILDPNPKIYFQGVKVLYEHGIRVSRYSSPELPSLIYDSCDAFKNPSKDELHLLERFKKEVYSKMEHNSLRIYLEDKYRYSNDETINDFNFDKELEVFAIYLIRREFVTFKAGNCTVSDSLKLLFYDSTYLPSSLDRTFKISNTTLKKVDNAVIDKNCSLPELFHFFEEKSAEEYKINELNIEAYREAIANMIIHRSYKINDSICYVEYDGTQVIIKNQASSNIKQEELNKLPKFSAASKPGDGIIALFFNLAGYCERVSKGQKTFKESNGAVSIGVSNDNVIVKVKTL